MFMTPLCLNRNSIVYLNPKQKITFVLQHLQPLNVHCWMWYMPIECNAGFCQPPSLIITKLCRGLWSYLSWCYFPSRGAPSWPTLRWVYHPREETERTHQSIYAYRVEVSSIWYLLSLCLTNLLNFIAICIK